MVRQGLPCRKVLCNEMENGRNIMMPVFPNVWGRGALFAYSGLEGTATYHDNLVAHEQEISQMDNGYAFEGICRQYLKDPSRQETLLTHTGFARPEDIHYYETLFPAMKLATRVSPVPVQILRAYMNGKHAGSVLDLLEPNHSGLLYPYVLENSQITSALKDGKLIYSNFENARIKLEENICLQVK